MVEVFEEQFGIPSYTKYSTITDSYDLTDSNLDQYEVVSNELTAMSELGYLKRTQDWFENSRITRENVVGKGVSPN